MDFQLFKNLNAFIFIIHKQNACEIWQRNVDGLGNRMAMASCLPFIARGLVYPLAYFHRSFKFLQTRQVMEIGSTVSYSSAVYNYEVYFENLFYIIINLDEDHHHT